MDSFEEKSGCIVTSQKAVLTAQRKYFAIRIKVVNEDISH